MPLPRPEPESVLAAIAARYRQAIEQVDADDPQGALATIGEVDRLLARADPDVTADAEVEALCRALMERLVIARDHYQREREEIANAARAADGYAFARASDPSGLDTRA